MNEGWRIGLAVDNLAESYERNIWRGIADKLTGKDTSLKCFVGGALAAPYNYSRKNFLFDLISGKNVDGLIIVSSSIGNYTSKKNLLNWLEGFSDIPTICIGLSLKNIPSLIIDNDNGIENLMKHFVEKHNRRKIAFIGGNPESLDSGIRFKAYKRVLTQYNLPYDQSLVIEGDFTSSSGIRAVNTLLDRKNTGFDAIIAANDEMALAAMSELQKRGFKIPEDISIGGFDNVPKSNHSEPPLTSVNQPIFEIGQKAAELILRKLKGEKVSSKTSMPSEMIIRESCGCKGLPHSTVELEPKSGKALIEFYKLKVETLQTKLEKTEQAFVKQKELNVFLQPLNTVKELKDKILFIFRSINVKSLCISLFDEREEFLEPIIVYKNNNFLKDSELPAPYEPGKLIPYSENKEHTRFIINTVISENEKKGIICLETNFDDIKYLEELTVQIDNIINRTVFFDKLKKHATELEEEVSKRTMQLELANREKTMFFINMAHETKTPLTLIKNYLKKYINDYGMNPDLAILKTNIDILLCNMVNYLDAEKLKNKQSFYNHDTIYNLSKIINLRIPLFKELGAAKNIKLETRITPLAYVRIDPIAIDRILNNLVDNAVKYTKEGGTITLSLIKDNGHILLKIKDTGIGISKEQLNNIFKPYHQLSHKKRNLQGLGMGLYIVKKITESVNAPIKIESKEGQGSSFIIRFKGESHEAKEIDGEPDSNYILPERQSLRLEEEEIRMGKRNLLLVEDNPDMLRFLQSFLKEEYNVFMALNGSDALAKLDIIPLPDLIISDIMMDEMNGFEFFEIINQIEKFLAIPLIFLTAKDESSEKLKGLSHGAIDYIRKPFDIEELRAKINSLLKISTAIKSQNSKLIEQKISAAFTEIKTESSNKYFKLNAVYKENRITKREQKIIELVVRGLANKAISQKLNISSRTVEFHIYNIFKKLKVRTRIELITLLKYI